jgi:plasmid stability protein
LKPLREELMAVNLSVKNVPDEIAEKLRERARRNHRSLQGEILALLEEAALPRKLTIEEAYARIRELGVKTRSDSVQIVRKMRDER